MLYMIKISVLEIKDLKKMIFIDQEMNIFWKKFVVRFYIGHVRNIRVQCNFDLIEFFEMYFKR